jgi:transcription initiation factor TFIIIB Brf1 subunit/transcription initiation factor TFIIB
MKMKFMALTIVTACKECKQKRDAAKVASAAVVQEDAAKVTSAAVVEEDAAKVTSAAIAEEKKDPV